MPNKSRNFFILSSRTDYKKAFTLTRKEIDIHVIKQLESVFVSFFSKCHNFHATTPKHKIAGMELFCGRSSCLKCLALGSARLA